MKPLVRSSAIACLAGIAALAQSPAIPPNTDNGYFVSANYFADLGRAPDPAGIPS